MKVWSFWKLEYVSEDVRVTWDQVSKNSSIIVVWIHRIANNKNSELKLIEQAFSNLKTNVYTYLEPVWKVCSLFQSKRNEYLPVQQPWVCLVIQCSYISILSVSFKRKLSISSFHKLIPGKCKIRWSTHCETLKGNWPSVCERITR